MLVPNMFTPVNRSVTSPAGRDQELRLLPPAVGWLTRPLGRRHRRRRVMAVYPHAAPPTPTPAIGRTRPSL